MNQEMTSYEVCGEVAVIRMNRSPINSLGFALRSGISHDIEKACKDDGVRAIVLAGTERAFSGGADIKEFGTADAVREPRLSVVIRSVEMSAKPVIAAISGVCLGGGLELALGAHFRVARSDARLGLPEIKLGLLPGAGGTQRLPRLVGLEAALNLILSGQSVQADQWASSGLLDLVVDEDVLGAAERFARDVVERGTPIQRSRDRFVQDAQGEAFIAFARQSVLNGKEKYLRAARQKCVDAVAASLLKDFDEGLDIERKSFSELLQSSESLALRHMFKAERAAAKGPQLVAGRSELGRQIRKVGVVGAGTMGAGIAMNFLNADMPVVLLESTQEALDRGLATMRRNYEASAKKGKISTARVEQSLSLLKSTLDHRLLAEADLVIEAVYEDMRVKEEVFRRLDGVCKSGAILASNTSYLDIDKIAAFTRRPQDVLGLHFFSPANVMRLLEVVRGACTSDEVLATALDLAKRIGKLPVVCGVCDGFIGNRMVSRYIAAANQLIASGALPQQVDSALERFGMAMGPCRMGDLAGLDIGSATRQRRAEEAGLPWEPVVADRLAALGRLGQKTGAGWYRYEPGRRDPIPDPTTEKLIDDFRAAKGLFSRRIDDEEIVERCMFALVNEGARIVEEGIADRAGDIDVVYLHGYGFPVHRGGPMFHADTVGLPKVVEALERFAAEPGADSWWRPAPLLASLAQQGKNFHSMGI
jgi:3-hydroxyacyl-CoA dehydrogenase